MTRILLVEDEPSLRMLIQDNLQQEGYEVTIAPDGMSGLEVFARLQPHLVILDVMLPGKDGFSIARSIRKSDQATPILFLTAKSRPKDVVQGFESGGNDYLKKPFGLEELLIRVKVLLSEHRMLPLKEEVPQTYTLGTAVVHIRKRQLEIPGQQTIQLTLRETDLLVMLTQNQEEVVPKEELLQTIWGDDSFLNSRSLDVFISRLRKYLRPAPQVEIVNQRGVGYMLIVHQQ